MIVRATVRFVASRASLLERRLMQHVLPGLLGLIGVAAQANVYGIGLGQTWLAAGMRVMTIGAIACGTRMRYFGLIDFFRLLAVAGHTQRFRIGLGQHHLAVLGRRVAQVAGLVRERRMKELPHQLRRR